MAAAAQPFHDGRREHAVSDHIPDLFDAITGFLQRSAPRSEDPVPPLDNDRIREAAQGHALARSKQGLRPADVLVEFRLLRQEVWHALQQALPQTAPSSDIVGAELVVNDALDGAAGMGLDALTMQLDQQREEFLASVMHEVRQPVTSIKGFIQLAQRLLSGSPPDNARAQSALEEARKATDRLDASVGTLLETSRLGLEGYAFQPQRCDIADIVTKVVTDLGEDVEGRVTVEIPPEMDTVGFWDVGGLTLVISNLLSNGTKYSSPHSPLTITLDAVGESVMISFRDEGIGISREDMPRLFERYARGRNAIEQGLVGTGLGLYFCRSIIEAHSGRIWATSEVGRGTTVVCELPRFAQMSDDFRASPSLLSRVGLD